MINYYFRFSEVFKARDRETRRLVALKKVLMENEKEGVSFCFKFRVSIILRISFGSTH